MISHLGSYLSLQLNCYLPILAGPFLTTGPSITGCWAALTPLVTYVLLSWLETLSLNFLTLSAFMDNPVVPLPPSICVLECLRPPQSHMGGQIFKGLLL